MCRNVVGNRANVATGAPNNHESPTGTQRITQKLTVTMAQCINAIDDLMNATMHEAEQFVTELLH
jgi:hypothetical protein